MEKEENNAVTEVLLDVQSMPESEPSGFNKFITLALTILVLSGIIWPLYSTDLGKMSLTPPSIPVPEIIKNLVSEVTDVDTEPPASPGISTPIIAPDANTPIITATGSTQALSEAQPTGKKIGVKLDRNRGFFSLVQGTLRIEPGDDVVWINEGSEPINLVSSDNIFEDRLLDNDKRTNHTFLKPGTYGFYLKENIDLKMTIVIQPLNIIESNLSE